MKNGPKPSLPVVLEGAMTQFLLKKEFPTTKESSPLLLSVAIGLLKALTEKSKEVPSPPLYCSEFSEMVEEGFSSSFFLQP